MSFFMKQFISSQRLAEEFGEQLLKTRRPDLVEAPKKLQFLEADSLVPERQPKREI